MKNLILLSSLFLLLTSCATSRISGWNKIFGGKSLSKVELEKEMQVAKSYWDKRDDKEQLLKALSSFENIANANNSYDAMTFLSRGYYLLADGHLENMDEKKKNWEIGITWGEKAMATNPEFKKRVIDNGEKIEDVLKYLDKGQIEAIYWTAVNLGKWGKNSGIATVLKYKTQIKNMINRVGELDKNFFYGAYDRYWGAYYAVAPGFAGGDMERSLQSFNSAIKTEKNYLGNYVLLADYWARKKGDKDMFVNNLNKVLKMNPNSVKAIAPENKIEQRKAKKLLDQVNEIF